MEVTRKTLSNSLPLLRAAVKDASFVAIDTELSGLHRAASEVAHLTDTPQLRYEKLKASSQAFAIIQFGVATFTWDTTIKKYVVRAFNFPVFPQAGKPIFGLDRRFLVESSAVDFLLSHNFNFDSAFKTGCPYMRRDEEEIAKANIAKLENFSLSNSIPLDHTNREFVEDAMARVLEWVENPVDETVAIRAENSYKKRLIHQEVRLRFNSSLSTSSQNSDIIVSKRTAEEQERILNGEDENKTKLNNELEYLVGFRRVIDIISSSRKPLVGHNMYLDLCQTIQKFCFELPPTVEEFKDVCHSLFPVIYDTKLVANMDSKIKDQIANSALSELTSQLTQSFRSPEFIMHPDFVNYLDSSATGKFHEAGYDAFSTGYSFLKMMYHIGNIPENEPFSFESCAPDVPRAACLYFENKLNVMRSDEPILNLVGQKGGVLKVFFISNDGGVSDNVDKSNVLYLANFPTSWRTQTIINLLHPHVGQSFVRWINDSSCFVTVSSCVDDVVVDTIKVSILSKRVLDGEKTGGENSRPLRVMRHDEYLALEEKLKKESKKLDIIKKRVRNENEEEEDGEIIEKDEGVEESNSVSGRQLKRQKKTDNSTCIVS